MRNKETEKLFKLAYTDAMTGVYNRNAYEEKLEKLNKVNARLDNIMVVIVDLDKLKCINDTYGHLFGDEVIQVVAKLLSDIMGEHKALIARYGGEEFVVMLYNTDAEAAMMVAERIRKNIAEQELVYENNKMSLTISIGVSVFDVENPITAKELVEMADRALYQSKANGRNRVTLADENTPPVQGK